MTQKRVNLCTKGEGEANLKIPFTVNSRGHKASSNTKISSSNYSDHIISALSYMITREMNETMVFSFCFETSDFFLFFAQNR